MSGEPKNVVEFDNYAVEFDADMEPVNLKGNGPKPDVETGSKILGLARDLLELAFQELGNLGETREAVRSRLRFIDKTDSFILLPPPGEISEVITRVTVVGDMDETAPAAASKQDTEVPDVSPEEAKAILRETRWELKRRAFRFHISLPFTAESLLKRCEERETIH